jgi:hypothetical protein
VKLTTGFYPSILRRIGIGGSGGEAVLTNLYIKYFTAEQLIHRKPTLSLINICIEILNLKNLQARPLGLINNYQEEALSLPTDKCNVVLFL